MKPAPQRLEPTFSPRIWGARSLAPLFPEKSNLAEPLGEAWVTGLDCKIATPEFRGKTLRDAWRDMPVDWRGAQFSANEEFPLLVKFIFPTDMLSLQVHPDDAYAAAHEKAAGGRGKTEMWHIVSADPGSHLLLGLKPGADKKAFLAGLKDNSLESLFQTVPIRAGDSIFVPPGTLHAIGPGVVVCEVQEYSDLTYRVYDYGRVDAQGKPRELHIEKALDVTNFGPGRGGKTTDVLLPVAGTAKRSLLAACSFFAVEKWIVESSCKFRTNAAHFDLLTSLSGCGVLNSCGREFPVEPGSCWLLPANLGEWHFAANEPATFIRAYVPNLDTLREEARTTANGASLKNTIFD
ncbi:MAG TPA: type I phosphomannose isomerase catalytic subunit [Candidatus Acidoferrum sp.]